MTLATVYSRATESLIQAALRGALTKVQARRLAGEDPEVLALALLSASKHIAEQNARLTPTRIGHRPPKKTAVHASRKDTIFNVSFRSTCHSPGS